VDLLDKVVSDKNDAVHSSMGMALPLVTNKDVLPIWEKMRTRQARIKLAKAQAFCVGQTVRFSKEVFRQGARAELDS
jgi:hypothetical protein